MLITSIRTHVFHHKKIFDYRQTFKNKLIKFRIQLNNRYISISKLRTIEDINDFHNFYIYENYRSRKYICDDIETFSPIIKWSLKDLWEDFMEHKSQYNNQFSEFLFSKFIDDEDNIASFEKVIKELIKENDMVTAYELFLKLTNTSTIRIPKSFYNWMMYGYLVNNDIDMVKSIFDQMKKFSTIDLLSYHILLKAYGNHNIVFDPDLVFRVLRSSLLMENVVTCNILLETYSKVDYSIDYSDKIFEHMKKMGIMPNIRTFYYLIKCSKNNLNKALYYVNIMDNYYLKKTDLIFEALLYVYINSGNRSLEDVKKFTNEFYKSSPYAKETYLSLHLLFDFYIKKGAYQEGIEKIKRYLNQEKDLIPISFFKKIFTSLKMIGIQNLINDIEKWENEFLKNEEECMDNTLINELIKKMNEWEKMADSININSN